MEMKTAVGDALKECDLVMKGGVTSGIVYPPAVIELSKQYRFRAIGGTSAGAIAAAATAAAEYGRESGGFEKLDAVRKKLSEEGFLEGLFQPSEETRPLLETLKDLQGVLSDAGGTEGGRGRTGMLRTVRAIGGALRRNGGKPYKTGAITGGLLGIALALVSTALSVLIYRTAGSPVEPVAAVILFALLALPIGISGYLLGGLVGGGRYLFRILTIGIPENFFGLCSGRPGGGKGAQREVLTDWLSHQVDEMAGIAAGQRPLTFGQLTRKNITLRMITSNLSQSQPYVVPFENNRFLFKRDEFARLFPERILHHLVDKAYQSDRVTPPPGHFFLPSPEDLPVALGLRLSLSFPLLISAVPLYAISLSAFARSKAGETLSLREEDLMLNWFSDGGISSNFPVQFFDAWLPERPTFGIKLEALPPEAFEGPQSDRPVVEPAYFSVVAKEGEQGGEEANLKAAAATISDPDEDDPRDAIYLPPANAPLVAKWRPLTKTPTPTGKGAPLSLPKFVWSIFETAQNYRDNMQSALPSYRERIVQVRLRDDEGGLNLMMPGDVLEGVIQKGRLAGEALLTRFNFEHHQWVRFRVLMAQLESNLLEMKDVLRRDNPAFNLQKLLADQSNKENRYPYSRDEAWGEKAFQRIEQLRNVVDTWDRPVFGQAIPKPEPSLRITPRV